MGKLNRRKFCACGCGIIISPTATWATGHNQRGIGRYLLFQVIPDNHKCACGCGELVASNRRFKQGHNTYLNRILPKIIPNHHECACGCGELVASDKRFKSGHNTPSNKGTGKSNQFPQLCGCGCGEYATPGCTYKKGHGRKGKGKPKPEAQLCACGCGDYASPGCIFISGHNSKIAHPMLGKHQTEEAKVKCGIKPEGFGEKISIALTGRTLSQEHCINIGLASSGRIWSQESREKLSITNTGKHHTEETLQKMRKPNTEEVKRNKTIANRKTWQKPGHAELMYAAHWGNPDWVEKIRIAKNLKPNNPETLIHLITQEYFTGWKYTGDYSIVIGGKNPDFVNEETKQIIEVYGDHWHKDEDPTIKAELYYQAGYETCVIWEHELQDLDEVILKLRRFCGIGGDLF